MKKKQLFKFVCVEAVKSKDGKHVEVLVSEKGHFIGVAHRDRSELPARVKVKHWRADQAPTVSLVERFVPAKQVRQFTRDIRKALKKDMLKAHRPKGAKEGDPIWVLAEDYADAMKKFGMKEPKAPTEAERKKHREDRQAAKRKARGEAAPPAPPSGSGDGDKGGDADK